MRTVYYNGTIFTADRTQPWATALLTEGKRILACGPDELILAQARRGDRRIDLQRQFVMPGFIESHAHCVWGGSVLLQLDLSTARSKNDFIEKVAAYAKSNKRAAILGGRWNEQAWAECPLPSKTWIDEVTGNIPLLLHRMDYHAALANSAALRLAGINAGTPNPQNGAIDRDQLGELTGILRDAAINLVQEALPKAGTAELIEAMEAAFREFRKYGITSVQDITLPEQVAPLERLAAEGKLPCRHFLRLPIESMQNYVDGSSPLPTATDMIRSGSFKIFADGSLGSSTAWFFEGYSDNPGNTGIPMDILVSGKLKELIGLAEQAGFQLSIHAIGDQTNAALIDLFEDALMGRGNKNRHRVEHVQHIRQKDIARFARLGLIASVQPHHLFYDGPWLERRLGNNRVSEAYPFKSMITAGISTCFGSDFPIVTCNPLAAIKSAVTRIIDSPEHLILEPGQRITLEEALFSYTIDAAYAEFAEDEKGSLAAGKLADFIMLEQNPFTMPPEELDSIRISSVVFDGITE
jgi:hypothetical protein